MNRITTDMLATLQPFAEVDSHRLGQLLPLCHRERFRQSIDPFRQRDWEGQVVYLTHGELKLTQADGAVRVLVGGTDRALFPISQAGQVPLASKAITDIEVLRIEEDAADIIVTWDQCMSEAVDESRGKETVGTNWHMMSGMFVAQTMRFGAFTSLPPAHIASLLERFQRSAFRQGDVVIRQGAAGDYYYLIEQGRCRVTCEVEGRTVELATLKAGDAFGEEALVSDFPRNATVTMDSDGVLLVLSKADFNALLREPLLQRCPAAEALHRVQRGAIWLDVRFSAEHQHDGLPRAINVPLNELRSAISRLDKSSEYIVYCQTGRRSAAAAFLLSQRGFNVALLEGGLRALGESDSK
jgi:rhodanese-related sulfurtransferase